MVAEDIVLKWALFSICVDLADYGIKPLKCVLDKVELFFLIVNYSSNRESWHDIKFFEIYSI